MLQRAEPRPTFSDVCIDLSNYLAVSGELDYDLALVESLAHHRLGHPMVPGQDHRVYWSEFAAARGVQLGG